MVAQQQLRRLPLKSSSCVDQAVMPPQGARQVISTYAAAAQLLIAGHAAVVADLATTHGLQW